MTGAGQAVLLVDLQNSFLHRDGVMNRLMGPLSGADRALDETTRMIRAARGLGVPVIYTQHAFRTDYADADRVFRDLLPDAMSAGGLRRDTWDSAIVDVLAPRATDTVVVKTRFDAFLRTDLAAVLGTLGVHTLAVAGVLTNVCVETTVRSAFQHDLVVHLLADCCAARTGDDHRRALTALERARFATVGSWRHWIDQRR